MRNAQTAHVPDASKESRCLLWRLKRVDDTKPCAGYAPMTKNNLAVHLKWLLKQGSSIPSLSAEAPPIERTRVSQQPTPPSDESELLSAIPEEHDNAGGREMAKASQQSFSTRNPRLNSQPDTWEDESPSTTTKEPVPKSTAKSG